MKKLFTLTFLAMILSFASFAQALYVPSSICAGSSGYAMDSLAPGGGTWSSSNTGVATVTAVPLYMGMVTGVAPGTAIISYTLSGILYTGTVTVTASPSPISGITSICVGGTSTFSDGTPGGVWSSSSPSVASIGASTGIQTGLTPGMTAIEYSIGGCTAYLYYDTVVGGPYVDTTIYGGSTVCVGSTIGLSDITGGGSWTSSNPSVATVSSTGVVTGVSAGTAIISYGITGTCGTSYATEVMTVISSVSAGTITGTTTVMATLTTPLYDGVAGGTWSSSNPSVATVSSAGVVTGVTAGTAVITYTVTGCGGSAYTTAVVTVTALDIISGNVLFTGIAYTGAVKVWLITFNPSTNDLEASDSTMVYCSSGTSVYYQFLNNPTDSYRIKADIYDTSALIGTYGYIPTYHTSSYYWYSATVLMHTNGTSDLSQDITMGSGTITGGPGFISGNVTTGANKGTSGAGAAGVRMYAINAAGNMMQQTVTDASGNYTFSTLPVGTYTVFPENLNYLTTALTSINITSGAAVVSGANFIEHTKSMTITPVTEAVSNVQSNTSSVFVFPNPSNGKLNVQWNALSAEKGTIIVSDITGRQVYTSTVNMNAGTGICQVDLSGLTNGLYMISIKSAAINYNNKVEIQK